MSVLLSQLWHDGLWLALCMLGVAAVFAAVVGAAWAISAYVTRSRVAMAAQHHAPPYVHRQPGATLAAVDDRHIVEEASLRLPDHAPGRVTYRRKHRKRLQRDLELMLCHAAMQRPRDDA